MRTPPKRRLTVAQAATELGTTSEGVRSRLKRGTLEGVREGGRVFVLLEGPDQTRPNAAPPRSDAAPTGDRAELVEELRARVAFLESELRTRTEENRRKDHLLAAALERPALEPPSDAREAPSKAAAPRPDTTGPPDDTRPWWRRWIAGRE